MNDEEVAFRIVRLYFEEIARTGFKRQLDLDQMVNAYFYTLKQLKNKDKAMKSISEKIIREEKEITSKEFPGSVKTTTVTTESIPVVKEVTTTTTVESNSSKPKVKTVSEIIEEK
ncbi:MAG: hypothetical protein WC821_03060 [archaeon]|jgi:hypothetical protein